MTAKIRGIFERPKGSGDWWIRYADRYGREHREKVGRRSAAIAAYQKRKTEIREGRFFPDELRHRVRVSFADIAADALVYAERHKSPRSAREDRWKMTRLLDWFRNRAAADLRPEEIDARLAELSRSGRAPATVNQYRALLSLTFSLAVRAGKAPENPLRRVPVRRTNNARVRFLTAAEETALRAALRRFSPAREPELDLALHTGMRRGEQYGLRWQDVDLERGLITIPRSKHGEKRWVPVNSIARRALESLAARAVNAATSPAPIPSASPASRTAGVSPPSPSAVIPVRPEQSRVATPVRRSLGEGGKNLSNPSTAPPSTHTHAVIPGAPPARRDQPEAGEGGPARRSLGEGGRNLPGIPLPARPPEGTSSRSRAADEGSAAPAAPPAVIPRSAPQAYDEESLRPSVKLSPTALVCAPRGRRWFDRCIEEAQIPNFRYHDLRHTFASRLVMAGVDLRTVQELMGHKTLLMTLRYAHLSAAHTREAIEKLAGEASLSTTGTETGTGVPAPLPPSP